VRLDWEWTGFPAEGHGSQAVLTWERAQSLIPYEAL
jgi:hypothetical protein